MKSLVLDAYKMFYYLTGSKVISYGGAIVLITVFNVILLMGLTMTLDGVFPLRAVAGIFSFPKSLAPGAVLALLLAAYARPGFIASAAQHGQAHYVKLLLLVLVCGAVLAYVALLKYA